MLGVVNLEQNNIIVNYQATPDEEGFSASGALRMGVSEMTRFGADDAFFDRLAQLMADCILRNIDVKDAVTKLRSDYLDMRYCFTEDSFNDKLDALLGKEVVVCDEVGSGIIPLSARDRQAREATGRLCIQLAARATRVVRLVCGIPTVIKE